MTFEEAVILKNQSKSPYMKSDAKLKVYVTPAVHEDLQRFLAFMKTNKATDESAKRFSSNNQYSVYGIGGFIDYTWYDCL